MMLLTASTARTISLRIRLLPRLVTQIQFSKETGQSTIVDSTYFTGKRGLTCSCISSVSTPPRRPASARDNSPIASVPPTAEAFEEAERRSTKKRASVAVFQYIERHLKAIYDADLNRPVSKLLLHSTEERVFDRRSLLPLLSLPGQSAILRHEQSVRHPLLKVPDDCCFGSRN